MPRKGSKIFIVRKFVNAVSAKDAIRKEKSCDVHDVFLDDMFHKEEVAIGFRK